MGLTESNAIPLQTTTTKKYLSSCTAYCTSDGKYYISFKCDPRYRSITPRDDDDTAVPDFFCCYSGHYTLKTCCNKTDDAFPSNYVDDLTCVDEPWWYYQWRLIIGMLTVLTVVLATMIIYFCSRQHGSCCRRRSARQPARANERVVYEITRDSALSLAERHFDPNSLNAFQPPPYDSASVEPPKYSELYGGVVSEQPDSPEHDVTARGQANLGFVEDRSSDVTTRGPANLGIAEGRRSDVTPVHMISVNKSMTSQNMDQSEVIFYNEIITPPDELPLQTLSNNSTAGISRNL